MNFHAKNDETVNFIFEIFNNRYIVSHNQLQLNSIEKCDLTKIALFKK